MEFNDAVNQASVRGGVIAKASEACKAIVVCASPTLILNISDGYKQGVLHVQEDSVLMDTLRRCVQEQYQEAMSEVTDTGEVTDG